jgi:predicted PurR-regulated permease PerM
MLFRPLSTVEFSKRAAIFIGLALAPVLVWILFDVILLVIAAILVAVLLHVIAEPFRWLRFPRNAALSLSGLLIIGALIGAGYLFGKGIASELQEVINRAREAEKAFTATLQGSELGMALLSHVQRGGFLVTDFLGKIFSVSAGILIGFIVAIFAGIFLAAQPLLYREGLSKLLPPQWRANADETFDHIAHALRLWLLGQLVEMVIVGALVGVAMFLVGLPSPFALAAIAGLAEFIPYIGPILAIVPSLLVAATLSLSAMLWTLVAYLIIHQIEGNLVMPIIQRRMVLVPPALMLLSIVTISYLFGAAGAIFAAPITVVLFVIVNKLYVRDTLGEAALLPGDPKA